MGNADDMDAGREGDRQPLLPVVIVSGLSGSGKSTALAVFEDMGFFAVDGLPTSFAPKVVELIAHGGMHHYTGIALGMDMRQSDFSPDYEQALVELRKLGFAPHVLFCEARPEMLLKRYATTRRPHPLEKEGLGLEQALAMERSRMRHLRKKADLVLDTSTFSIHDLRRAIQGKWKIVSQLTRALKVHFITFGFKYGVPSEADMLFDLRFLPNPYFIPELRPLSGRDEAVATYVLDQDQGREFLHRLTDFLHYVLARYDAEGRFRLTIAIGCTGGRHRSVAVAEALVKSLRNEYSLTLEHRHFELG